MIQGLEPSISAPALRGDICRFRCCKGSQLTNSTVFRPAKHLSPLLRVPRPEPWAHPHDSKRKVNGSHLLLPELLSHVRHPSVLLWAALEVSCRKANVAAGPGSSNSSQNLDLALGWPSTPTAMPSQRRCVSPGLSDLVCYLIGPFTCFASGSDMSNVPASQS